MSDIVYKKVQNFSSYNNVQYNSFFNQQKLEKAGAALVITITSVARAMKVLRKLGCCLQIEVGIV